MKWAGLRDLEDLASKENGNNLPQKETDQIACWMRDATCGIGPRHMRRIPCVKYLTVLSRLLCARNNRSSHRQLVERVLPVEIAFKSIEKAMLR